MDAQVKLNLAGFINESANESLSEVVGRLSCCLPYKDDLNTKYVSSFPKWNSRLQETYNIFKIIAVISL